MTYSQKKEIFMKTRNAYLLIYQRNTQSKYNEVSMPNEIQEIVDQENYKLTTLQLLFNKHSISNTQYIIMQQLLHSQPTKFEYK
jgi:hypothetical protein